MMQSIDFIKIGMCAVVCIASVFASILIYSQYLNGIGCLDEYGILIKTPQCESDANKTWVVVGLIPPVVLLTSIYIMFIRQKVVPTSALLPENPAIYVESTPITVRSGEVVKVDGLYRYAWHDKIGTNCNPTQKEKDGVILVRGTEAPTLECCDHVVGWRLVTS